MASDAAPPARRRSVRFGEADDAQSDPSSMVPTATPQKVQEFFKDLPPNTVQRASPRTDTKSLPVGVLKDTPARAVTAANRAAAYARDDAMRQPLFASAGADVGEGGNGEGTSGARFPYGQGYGDSSSSASASDADLSSESDTGWINDMALESELGQTRASAATNSSDDEEDADVAEGGALANSQRTEELAALGKALLCSLGAGWPLPPIPRQIVHNY